MAKSLFAESAMFIGRKSKLATGTSIGVSSNFPEKIVLMHLKSGLFRAMTIDQNEVSEIYFKDIEKIGICNEPGYNDGKHMEITMLNGEKYLFSFKKEIKATSSVQALNELRIAALSQ